MLNHRDALFLAQERLLRTFVPLLEDQGQRDELRAQWDKLRYGAEREAAAIHEEQQG